MNREVIRALGPTRKRRSQRYKIERRKTDTYKGKPRSLTTINREIELLRHALSMALRDGHIRTHPMKNGKVRLYKVNNKIERFLSDEEETRLLSACVGRYEHLRPIIVTALYTGMRRGEIFNLKWSDVDFKNSRLHIRESKSGRPRSIHIALNVRAEIERLLPLASESEYVFGNPHTGQARTDLKNGFTAICKAAGITRLRFHDLRHTFATRLATASGNLVDVAHALGHSQISTTMRYAHAIPDRVAEAIDQMATRPKRAEVVPLVRARVEAAR
jgi:integrase